MRHRLVVIVDSAKLGDAIKAITPYALVHVQTQPADAPSEPAARTRRVRGSKPVQETRLGRMILSMLANGSRMDGDMASRLKDEGFAPSSLSSTTSALKKAGLIERSSPDGWRLTEGDAK